VLAAIAGNAARWWQSLRAVVKARLAMAVLKQGQAERCVALLTESVGYADSWWEHPALATVLEACAVYTLSQPGGLDPDSRDPGARDPGARDPGAQDPGGPDPRGRRRAVSPPTGRGPRDPRRVRRVQPGRAVRPRPGPRDTRPGGVRRGLRIRPRQHLRVGDRPRPRASPRRHRRRPASLTARQPECPVAWVPGGPPA